MTMFVSVYSILIHLCVCFCTAKISLGFSCNPRYANYIDIATFQMTRMPCSLSLYLQAIHRNKSVIFDLM